MNRELMRTVRQRAGDRCEYCRMPSWALPLPFQIDHIVAEKHGGQTVENNLALACPHCNRFKGRVLGINGTENRVKVTLVLQSPAPTRARQQR